MERTLFSNFICIKKEPELNNPPQLSFVFLALPSRPSFRDGRGFLTVLIIILRLIKVIKVLKLNVILQFSPRESKEVTIRIENMCLVQESDHYRTLATIYKSYHDCVNRFPSDPSPPPYLTHAHIPRGTLDVDGETRRSLFFSLYACQIG